MTDNRIIGGFDPSNVSGTNNASSWTDAVGNFAVSAVKPNDQGTQGFPTNGLKTIQIYATDDAGAVGNIITIQLTLQASDLPPTGPPTKVTLALRPSEAVVVNGVTYTKSSTPDFDGVTDPTAKSVELLQVINGVPTPFSPPVITTQIDPVTGAFHLQLPSSPDSPPSYTVIARATNVKGSTDSNQVSFNIKTHGPTQTPTLSLNPADDSGIVGDNITNVRKPHFIGTIGPANAGSVIQIYQATSQGNPTGPVLATTTAAS